MKLSSNRTYIIPTLFGTVLLMVISLAFIISVTFGHPFSYFITFFSVSILITCAFSTNYSIHNLKTFKFNDEFIEASKASNIIFYITEREFKFNFRVTVSAAEESANKVIVLGSMNNKLSVPIFKKACGIFKVARIKIESTYPLGIFKAWKYVESGKDLIVYPSRQGGFTAQYKSGSNRPSPKYSNFSSNKDEFLEHRSFKSTDSWKHVDWKAYARGRGLLTKKFSSSNSSFISFRIDKNSSLFYLGQVTNEIIESYDKSENTALFLNGENISSGKNNVHLRKCLRVLAEMGSACE